MRVTGNVVYLVEGKRTPQVKAGFELKDVSAPFLGSSLLRSILDSTDISNEEVDEVIFGNTGAPAKYANISRVISLIAGLSQSVSASTVHRNCASGMEALCQGHLKILSGRCHVVFAGGIENMSQMPLIYSKEMTDLFIKVNKAKSFSEKVKALSLFRPPHLSPIVAMEQGLTDPICGLNMGQTAELLAREYNISREDQDLFAHHSHQRAIQAQEEGKFEAEIIPLMTGIKRNKILWTDIGPRRNSSPESLSKLRPCFEKKSGSITVGNSCPITDGGSLWLMASEEAVKKYNLKPMARLVDYHFHGLGPERMGMGPLVAIDGLLKRTKLELDQIDLFEINEAFAAQVLCVLKGLEEKELSSQYGVDRAWGQIPLEKLNVNGGGIALGHPVGSSGSRIVVTLAHELKRRKGKFGLAAMCVGGGQGGAILIENLAAS
jgi:acetyl-CoA C-acetyltransferase/acetyl-CoA acyltransferase